MTLPRISAWHRHSIELGAETIGLETKPRGNCFTIARRMMQQQAGWIADPSPADQVQSTGWAAAGR